MKISLINPNVKNKTLKRKLEPPVIMENVACSTRKQRNL